jgi:hypothetical protein
MFEKAGKFYADWRDQDGHRLRKSFKTRRAALQFEVEQKELAHPKQTARGQRSPRSSAPRTLGRKPIAPTATPPIKSSGKLVPFRRHV